MQQILSGLLVALVLLVSSSQLYVAASGADKDGYQPQQRALLQDALGNSNGCLGTIPKCEPGACATRDVMGKARWVCLRCLANYEPVVDGSGQDNIIQCGKPPPSPSSHHHDSSTIIIIIIILLACIYMIGVVL